MLNHLTGCVTIDWRLSALRTAHTGIMSGSEKCCVRVSLSFFGIRSILLTFAAFDISAFHTNGTQTHTRIRNTRLRFHSHTISFVHGNLAASASVVYFEGVCLHSTHDRLTVLHRNRTDWVSSWSDIGYARIFDARVNFRILSQSDNYWNPPTRRTCRSTLSRARVPRKSGFYLKSIDCFSLEKALHFASPPSPQRSKVAKIKYANRTSTKTRTLRCDRVLSRHSVTLCV